MVSVKLNINQVVVTQSNNQPKQDIRQQFEEAQKVVKNIEFQEALSQFIQKILGNKDVPQNLKSQQCKDGSEYFGEVKNDQINGFGYLKKIGGILLMGRFYNGSIDEGVILFPQTRNAYIGELKNSQRSGYGIMYNDDYRKEGQYNHDETIGKVKYVYSDGEFLEVEMKNYKRHGPGVISFKNGDTFEGVYIEGKLVGNSTLRYANSSEYTGQFKDNKRHGKGKYTKYDGSIYEGEYANDKLNGFGKYIYRSGHIYIGEFKNDKMYGYGSYMWTNGDIYHGQYKDDQKCGKGRFNFVEGPILSYDGYWKDGQKSGQGTLIWKNGDRYDGQFLNDRMDGSGVLTNHKGEIQRGTWYNDKFQKPQKNREPQDKIFRNQATKATGDLDF
eukprot:403350443